MQRQRGFLTLESALTLGAYLLFGTLFLGTLITTLMRYQESVAISQQVKTLAQAATTAYRLDTLKRRCLSSNRQTSTTDLVTQQLLSTGDYSRYQVSYRFTHQPYTYPNQVVTTVTFVSKNDKNAVSRYLNASKETDLSLTFTTPINRSRIGIEYLNAQTGCYF
ncbi:hypothetical protein C9J12_25675 [Photobacterium frigidiphilum]|uniref:Type II secretion system protein n=1 Tax=Photobacterium frigidiphilum TaxID=264736 RepID=A0A2T3J7R1_9GAMM|nr:hypothetical protein [Photobacterium frigidiphilum]PSU44790.1 hypothetical protein C9J12_25675 [Photobacterium frigidiphilum]